MEREASPQQHRNQDEASNAEAQQCHVAGIQLRRDPEPCNWAPTGPDRRSGKAEGSPLKIIWTWRLHQTATLRSGRQANRVPLTPLCQQPKNITGSDRTLLLPDQGRADDASSLPNRVPQGPGLHQGVGRCLYRLAGSQGQTSACVSRTSQSSSLRATAEVPPADRKKLFSENALRLYRIRFGQGSRDGEADGRR